MSGYDTIELIKFLEEEVDKLGLQITKGQDYHRVAVIPKKNSVGVYHPSTRLFVGTLEELEYWILGVRWARDHDMVLFGSKHNERRERKEQDVRNRKLVEIIKQ